MLMILMHASCLGHNLFICLHIENRNGIHSTYVNCDPEEFYSTNVMQLAEKNVSLTLKWLNFYCF